MQQHVDFIQCYMTMHINDMIYIYINVGMGSLFQQTHATEATSH